MEIIVGALVSVIAQLTKKYVPGEWAKMLLVVVLCLAAAGIYTTLTAFGYWQTFATVLITAGAFYAFIIQRFEN